MPSCDLRGFPKIVGERRSRNPRAHCKWHVGCRGKCRQLVVVPELRCDTSRDGSGSGDPGSSRRQVSKWLLAASSGAGTGWCTLGLIQKVAMAIHRRWLAWKWGFLGGMALVFKGYSQMAAPKRQCGGCFSARAGRGVSSSPRSNTKHYRKWGICCEMWPFPGYILVDS